jgi:hypothetical protein
MDLLRNGETHEDKQQFSTDNPSASNENESNDNNITGVQQTGDHNHKPSSARIRKTELGNMIRSFHNSITEKCYLDKLFQSIQSKAPDEYRFTADEVWKTYCNMFAKKERKVRFASNTNPTKNKRKRDESENETTDESDKQEQNVDETNKILKEHFSLLKKESSPKSKKQKRHDTKIKEKAKEILVNERVNMIRNFWDIPGKKIYVDCLNLSRTVDRIVEIRKLFPESVQVCFVVRECIECELSLEVLKDIPDIEYIYLSSSTSDDDFVLLSELVVTDGLFLSDDLFRNTSDETLKNILNIDHLWIEKRRLEYYMKKGDTFKLVHQKWINELAIIPDKKGDQ